MIRPLLILYLLRLHSLCLLKITIILTNILFLLRLLSLYLLSILILKNFMYKIPKCMSAFSTMNDRQTELPQPFYLTNEGIYSTYFKEFCPLRALVLAHPFLPNAHPNPTMKHVNPIFTICTYLLEPM
jgi:hypothetical protein